MFELVEPIATVTFSEVPNEAFLALGMRNYWDGYFAGRAAPLGLAPAEVVHAIFYNFADGEVARHIPWVWGKTTPQEAIAVRERGSAAALRQLIGELADAPGLVRVADLATRAAVSAPTEGRALYAGLQALDVPKEPVARLWHAATLLREHRGDGHNAALLAHGIGGTEAHVMLPPFASIDLWSTVTATHVTGVAVIARPRALDPPTCAGRRPARHPPAARVPVSRSSPAEWVPPGPRSVRRSWAPGPRRP
jgi:hypothetical protein